MIMSKWSVRTCAYTSLLAAHCARCDEKTNNAILNQVRVKIQNSHVPVYIRVCFVDLFSIFLPFQCLACGILSNFINVMEWSATRATKT